jgi:hypothetical protein
MAGEEGHFVFATKRYTEALVYAMVSARSLFNFQIRNFDTGAIIDAQVVAVPDGQKDIGDFEPNYSGGSVVRVNPDTFREVSYLKDGRFFSPGEWVSERPVEVFETVSTLSGVEQIMQQGLLVFTINYSDIKSNASYRELVEGANQKGLYIRQSRNGLVYTATADEYERGVWELYKHPQKLRDLVEMMAGNHGQNSLAMAYRGYATLLNAQIDGGLDFLSKPAP